MKQNQNHKRVMSGDKRCPASVSIALRRDKMLDEGIIEDHREYPDQGDAD